MNWQALAQRLGSLLREMPQSVHRLRGTAELTGTTQTGGRGFNVAARSERSADIGNGCWRGNSQPLA